VKNIPSPRRFPPPWSIDELQALAYVYFEEEHGQRNSGQAAHQRLRCDETHYQKL
jgi:hypothetical protein